MIRFIKRSMAMGSFWVAMLLFFGIAGTVETLPPTAGFEEWATVAVFTLIAAGLGLIGISFMESSR